MTQLEALRLADMLENNYPLEPEAEEAAAELRRLHEENERLRQALAQPEQEPVAWGMRRKDGVILDIKNADFEHEGYEKIYTVPLYTAPPKREWVGLTDEERADCWSSSAVQSAINIEAKLKEKNT